MVKKILIALETLLLIGAIVFGIMTYMQKVKVIADRDVLLSENQTLNQKVQAIGDTTEVFTVKSDMAVGTPVMLEDLQRVTVPVSAVPKNAVTDANQIIYVDPVSGAKDYKYYKVAVGPLTMLTEDMMMTEDYTQPLYERDVYLDWLPIGLKAHDTIDIRISYPDGTDLVVFSHKRVYMVIDNVIKLKMSYGELLRYTSLLTEKEFYQSANLGVRVYATAYIEPGLTKENKAKIMYPLSAGASMLAVRDPNIPDKDEFINQDLRTWLDQKMATYIDDEDKLNFGIYSTNMMVTNETSALTTGMDKFDEMYSKLASDEAIEQPTDLTGTGWDGEIVGGGKPYKNEVSSPVGAEGESADGMGTLPGGAGTESLGGLDGSMDNLQTSVNDSYDQLNDLAGQVQSGEIGGSGQTTQQPPTVQTGGQMQGTVTPQETMPSGTGQAGSNGTVQETQPAVQETQPAVQETQAQTGTSGGGTTEPDDTPASAQTQPAADSQGNTQGVTNDQQDASRQSGNLFTNPGIE